MRSFPKRRVLQGGELRAMEAEEGGMCIVEWEAENRTGTLGTLETTFTI